MKRHVRYFLLIAIVIMFSSSQVYAEDQTPTETPEIEVAETPSIEPTPTSTPTPTPTPIEISGITDNSLYLELLSKKETINTLNAEENQVCASIRDQEASNGKAVSLITDKIKSYNSPYLKIIDEIKSLLSQIREKRTQNIVKSLENKETVTPVNPAKTPDKAGSTNTLGEEIEMSTYQIASLNRAVKYMRDSIKYISLESAEYNKKIQAVQQQVDKINDQITELNNKIIEDKYLKSIEWESFCSEMYNKDVALADTSYKNIIEIKTRIVNNYKEILNLKKNIEKLLTTLV